MFARILIFLLISNWAFAQGYVKLQDKLNQHLNHKVFESANVSLSVIDIKSQKLIASHRPKKILVPASSLKLFTTFTALDKLGKDFQFETTIAYDGQLQEDGTLIGNLIIIGGGDPTLGSTDIDGTLGFTALLQDIKTAIKSSGINCIQGNLILDESIFDSYPIAPTWQWNDLGNYYATGAWGINVNQNLYFVHFDQRSVIGNRPRIQSVFPKVPQLDLSNEIVVDSAHTGDQAYIFGGPYNYNKRVVGTIPQGKKPFTIKGSIPDPPSFFGYHLKRHLENENIQIGEIENHFRKYKRKNLVTIKTYKSPALSKIVWKANQESNNLYTEALLKMIGLKSRGLGSGQNGINIIEKYLKKWKVNTDKLILRDGSGLSARNNISSFSMAAFLAGMSKVHGQEEILNYLPKGGYTGTVKGLFKKSKARGHIWLKSGSMEGVQSYSGYVQAASGEWYSFSVIVNGYTAKSNEIRSKLEQIIKQIYFHA